MPPDLWWWLIYLFLVKSIQDCRTEYALSIQLTSGFYLPIVFSRYTIDTKPNWFFSLQTQWEEKNDFINFRSLTDCTEQTIFMGRSVVHFMRTRIFISKRWLHPPTAKTPILTMLSLATYCMYAYGFQFINTDGRGHKFYRNRTNQFERIEANTHKIYKILYSQAHKRPHAICRTHIGHIYFTLCSLLTAEWNIFINRYESSIEHRALEVMPAHDREKLLYFYFAHRRADGADVRRYRQTHQKQQQQMQHQPNKQTKNQFRYILTSELGARTHFYPLFLHRDVGISFPSRIDLFPSAWCELCACTWKLACQWCWCFGVASSLGPFISFTYHFQNAPSQSIDNGTKY